MACDYRDKINTIFERNGIIFYLDENGFIKRTIPESLKGIISELRFGKPLVL